MSGRVSKLSNKSPSFPYQIPFKAINRDGFKFKMPFAAIIAGPQSSGKTSFLVRLLKDKDHMFDPVPAEIAYCYGEFNSAIPKLNKMGVIVHHGIPDDDFLNKRKKPLLLILDDLMLTMDKKYLDLLFTVKSHHRNIGVIFVVQNLFDKNIKTARDNCQYLILMRSPSSVRQVRDIGTSLFPHKTKNFMEIYDRATGKLYGYLLIDQHASTPNEFRLRSQIFPGEFMRVFEP